MRPTKTSARRLALALCDRLNEIYCPGRGNLMLDPEVPDVPAKGRGYDALPDLGSLVVAGSTNLASPSMMAHMDVSPHPAAALSDAIVSALNNNLLFRELSPVASRIEESLVALFTDALDLDRRWTGTFVSGGSLASLTALFAACGGFGDRQRRDEQRLYVSESVHSSITKAAAVLGLAAPHVILVPSDSTGRMKVGALEQSLAANRGHLSIVVGILGSTLHGAVDSLAGLGHTAMKHGAWFHIDAVYGGALAFSRRNRALLEGLELADSMALGPQKWMYVPRLCALLLIKGRDCFDASLGMDLPYSVTGEQHRGKWGLQGSRRADAVTLWLMLQVVGTNQIGEFIDRSIDLTAKFHDLPQASEVYEPIHDPQLNLQCFRARKGWSGTSAEALHWRLTQELGPCVSLVHWRGEPLLRSVLLSPATELADLENLLAALTRMGRTAR